VAGFVLMLASFDSFAMRGSDSRWEVVAIVSDGAHDDSVYSLGEQLERDELDVAAELRID
jgi:hypothetical protein